MVSKQFLRIPGTFILMILIIPLVCSPVHSQDREEVIIEGQDRSPSGSVTEYGEDEQSGNTNGSETTDSPEPSVDRSIEQPELDRKIQTGSDTETQETGTLLGSDSSYKWLWGVAIGAAIIIIAL